MGYLYENSNPERFQQFCQSLLIASFPRLQCFPVGQPDGGRDGLDPESKTVLQVKFKRTDDNGNADWLIEALEKELPKIRRLAERGARRYIIATNARGTSHPDSGRIDRVQQWFDDNLPIPGTCFWRDEIDRRFESSSTSLKLKYSELLSLEDGIDVVLNSVLRMDHGRHEDAIRAFIAAQFNADKTVKFKQVNLSNDLLDLFIDVPVSLSRRFFGRQGRGSSPANEGLRKFLSEMAASYRATYADDELGRNVVLRSAVAPFSGDAPIAGANLSLGAAELLLGSAAQDHLRLVVLQGAPGQGKSTLAQYVCQIHRARYLRRQDILDSVPEAYKHTAFRVPLKVDLRDYAAFLDDNSPLVSASAPSGPRTLEVFLAQLIVYNSGGIQFDAHDVLTVLKKAPVLLFLDGLDEVADVMARDALVSSVGEALARWKEFDANVQVVVTSRPSVFGRAPGFRKFGFVTLALDNIDSARIEAYADKWVVARSLNEAEKVDVKNILAEKLELAHIRDLTRNLMQLTILLSLIHQVGHSLADQRTALYDQYVDLFLTREADKSVPVREHRPILLGFIQHLAWVLQTQAESSKSAGSISAPQLQEMARAYLRDGGYPVEIADDFFGGGLERIFVLVERIEGLYEFEVQPLREFFCAQYLYSTAPVGTYRNSVLQGDRAQRFEALAANPLWLNVCRFYAGSCQRGETGTLVFSLKEMIKAGDLAVANHARRVGLALLHDWVFSNVKFAQDELIHAIFDLPGTQILIAGEGFVSDELILAAECGRNTLRDLVFAQLKRSPDDPRVPLLCYLLRANGGRHLGEHFRDLLRTKGGRDRSRQLILMFSAGASKDLDPGLIWQLIVKDDPDRDELLWRISALVAAEPTVAVEIPELVREFVAGVLDGLIGGRGYPRSVLGVFAALVGSPPGIYLGGRSSGMRLITKKLSKARSIETVPEAVRNFLDSVLKVTFDSDDDASIEACDSPEFCSAIVENARESFGETWAAMSIAIRTAGIKAARKLPVDASRLSDKAVPLCLRARSARLRRGGIRWWLEELDHMDTALDRMLWAGLVLMWSSPQNLYALASQTNEIVDALGDGEYGALRTTLSSVSVDRELRSDRKKLSEVDLRPFSNRTAVLVAIAFGAHTSVLRYTTRQERAEPMRTFLRSKREIEEIGELPSWKDVERALAWTTRVAHLENSGGKVPFAATRHIGESRIRADIAARVLREPTLYPHEFVARAVFQVQRDYRPVPLAVTAREELWEFE